MLVVARHYRYERCRENVASHSAKNRLDDGGRETLLLESHDVGSLIPANDDMEMMCPERCLRMMGRTARVTFIGPMRVVASCLSNCSCVNSSK